MSGQIKARLDMIRDRAKKATPGPWVAEYSKEQGNCVIPHDARSTREAVAVTRLFHQQADAEFIAAARTDVEQMEQALRAVLDLHKPYEWSFGYGPVHSCTECTRLGGNNSKEEEVEWPCPTVRVITDALGLEGDDDDDLG